MKDIKNYGHSVKNRLLILSKELNRSNQELITRYLHERLLYRLSISEYRDKFCLKGGALLYAYEHLEARPTVDIDFLGEQINRDMEHIKNVFTRIAQKNCVEDGVIFNVNDIELEELQLNKEYNGVRVHLVAGIDSIRQRVSVDIGFGDVVIPEAQIIEYPRLFESIPVAIIRAYSLETIVAEKFQAMVALDDKNSRMKDYFDVYRILKNHIVDENLLSQSIKATFENRHTEVNLDAPFFQQSFTTDLQRNTNWKNFLKKIRCKDEIPFADVYNLIMTRLRQYLPISSDV